MVLRHAYGKVTWIDLESPSQDELRHVLAEFDLDARIEDEIISPTAYPLFVPFDDYVYAILHFPTSAREGGAKNQEVDFIIGKDFLITCRYEVIDSIYNLHKVFEAEELLGVTRSHVKAPELLERILRRLYGALGRETEDVASRLERIERDIFSGRERVTVKAISEIGRTLLRFETTLMHHAEVLHSLIGALAAPQFFGKGFNEHGVHIKAERDHAAHLISSYRDVTHELRDTNDSLLSSAQNEIIKKLTIITFITFPPLLIAGIFAMDTIEGMPLIGIPHNFWIVIGFMIFSSLLIYLFFRTRRWL